MDPNEANWRNQPNLDHDMGDETSITEEQSLDMEFEEEKLQPPKKVVLKLDRNDEEIDQPRPRLVRQLAVSMLPSSTGIPQLNTFSGVDEGATFAVWNLWDLGGGFQPKHWTNNDEAALKELPNELAAIGADVIGLLEIKTGHTTAPQLPKDKADITAFEIGAMIAYVFQRYITEAGLFRDTSQPAQTLEQVFNDLSNLFWIGDDTKYLLKGLITGENLSTILHPKDLETVVKDMIFNWDNFLFSMKGEEAKIVFERISEKWTEHSFAIKGYPFSYYSDPGAELAPIIRSTGKVAEFWLGKRLVLKNTWKLVKIAFENAGNVEEAQGEPSKVAVGIPLLSKALNTFVISNPSFKYCIIDPVSGDGETTAFLYDTKKFDYCCHGSIQLVGNGWRCRSPGFIHLKAKPGILNREDMMVVAWHAPSENNVGERQHGYEYLNELLKVRHALKNCLRNSNVVLLADLNIRSQPSSWEPNILSVFDDWLPVRNVHMSLCTSLRKTGTNGAQWNYPFDKVLLLNLKDLQLEISAPVRMADARSAEDIRRFSDHSWVKARIKVAQKYYF